MPVTTSSKSSQQTNAASTKSRDPSADPPTRHDASAYADQFDYDAYRKPAATKQYEVDRDVYPSQPQATIHENSKYRQTHVQETYDDDYPTTATNDYAPVQQQHNSKPAVYGGQLGRSNTYHGAQLRATSAKQRNPSQGTYVPYLVETCTHFVEEIVTDRSLFVQKTNNSALAREKAMSMNRGSRSGSAPTPTPPPAKPTVNGSNFSYNRRSTVVSNDERPGANEKNSGAQAKVNQKFVNFRDLFRTRPSERSLSLCRCPAFDLLQLLIFEPRLVFNRPQQRRNRSIRVHHHRRLDRMPVNPNVVQTWDTILTRLRR
jgi:hypothetical protein